MAFREVLVTQVREVLRAWLSGAGKRPAARRAGVDVKTAQRYIKAAQTAGLARGGDESQLTEELLGQVVAAVRPARPAGHGASWEALAPVKAEITGWVKDGLTLVKMHEFLERSGSGRAVPDAGPVRRGRMRVLLLVPAAGDGAGGRRQARRGGTAGFRLPGHDRRRGPAQAAARAGVHRGAVRGTASCT